MGGSKWVTLWMIQPDGTRVKAGKITRKQQKKMLEAQKRASQLSGMKRNPYSGSYSQERLDKAMYAEAGQEALVDSILRGDTETWWRNISLEERSAAYDFTGNYYDYMNEMLGGRTKPENIKDKNVDRINHLTNALEKSEIKTDMWVRRGVSPSHIGRMVGIDSDTSYKFPEHVLDKIQEAIDNDKIFDIANFMSTAGTKGTGFDSDFEMKIFVPKGTKGVYAEPFSAHSPSGYKGLWDGKEKQKYFGGEFEILLQRGYKLKPIALNKGQGKSGANQIVFTIVGKDTKPYVKPQL